jgi:hypothetical protein
MRRIVSRMLVVAGVGAGATVVRRWLSSATGTQADRWLAVTVYRGPDEVMPGGRLPEPLSRLGDRVEVRVRPAPAGKGTEILARPREEVPPGGQGLAARVAGTDPRQEIRLALREAKSLLETGEVLQPARPGSNHPTIPGKLLDLVTSRAAGEGRL